PVTHHRHAGARPNHRQRLPAGHRDDGRRAVESSLHRQDGAGSEAGVDLEELRAVARQEALHVAGPDDRQRLADSLRVNLEIPVAERPAPVRLAALDLLPDTWRRGEESAAEIAEAIDRHLGAGRERLHDRVWDLANEEAILIDVVGPIVVDARSTATR